MKLSEAMKKATQGPLIVKSRHDEFSGLPGYYIGTKDNMYDHVASVFSDDDITDAALLADSYNKRVMALEALKIANRQLTELHTPIYDREHLIQAIAALEEVEGI